MKAYVHAYEKGEGNIKEAAGHLTGHRKLENEGKVDKVKGAVHSAVGDVKDSVKKTSQRR